jgi:hypothetical protein
MHLFERWGNMDLRPESEFLKDLNARRRPASAVADFILGQSDSDGGAPAPTFAQPLQPAGIFPIIPS